jgi:hypothetical protein
MLLFKTTYYIEINFGSIKENISYLNFVIFESCVFELNLVKFNTYTNPIYTTAVCVSLVKPPNIINTQLGKPFRIHNIYNKSDKV